ncbi:cysteine proteinase [Gymnopus androsaceus JB14]|uniref:Cysteine proteinase n=1 Tax=Gymnopus androsaceus JB14 TaxID=1447944 RepID=A0A6A4IIH9_9AGAR|nr:cysteine proteinase [Gymnopus androsaceus JB14]
MQKDGQLRDGLWIKKVPSLYDKNQVSNWLFRIKYPGNWSADKVDNFEATLDNLCLLVRLQIVAFTFENTAMHYTSHHSMDISHSGLYQRLVVEGKGSYCFGMNTLFLQMIRALGYRAFSGAARINTASPDAPPNFLAFVHKILFVQPFRDSNTTYFVDASGGGSCLTRPILLKPGAKVLGATPSEWHTLVKTSRPESSLAYSPDSNETARLEWRLVVSHTPRNGPTSTKIIYSFPEDEFFNADYDASNIGIYTGVWARKESFWQENIVCSRCFWLTDEEMAGETNDQLESSQGDVYSEGAIPRWDGSLMSRYLGRLGLQKNELKRHVGTHSETVKTFHTELERMAILREFFGIDISQTDLENIRGRAPALELP